VILTFTPDEGEKQEWRFRGDKLMTTEAEAVEKVTGMTYAEFGERLLNGNPTARRAVVWVMRKRTEPTLRFGEVDFPMGALRLDFEDEEKAEMRDAILADRTYSVKDKREALAELGFDDEIVDPSDLGKDAPVEG
jgi:hypothetical protein